MEGDLSVKKVLTAKNCADVGNEASLCFSTATNIACLQDWYSTEH